LNEEIRHRPVLLREVLEYLDVARGGLYFDGTLGDGGHSEAILESGEGTRVIGVDQDPEAIEVASKRLSRYGDRLTLVESNFLAAAEAVAEPLSGALLDLGVSSRHLDERSRGFSFRPGTPLDMRMTGASSDTPTAADLLNELPESELADVFYQYGEERRSRRLASAIVTQRRSARFSTSDDLMAVLFRALGPRLDAQDRARLFQALRIAVNDELGVLDRVLPILRDRLSGGGVFVVISYHSLEDRRIKESFREWSRTCICPPALPVCVCRGEPLGEVLTRRPVLPSAAEIAENPRARSARLRAWRKSSS
jgi:16S rRNA (cytosine1402-N4)-methyltransferase